MQFKYPELLYALFLLIIPVLIHLFQLRKFEKVAFTNVKFLQKIVLQTRKSSKLKKFLILLTRLLFITSIVFAFAQPFFSKHKKNQKLQTIVYLDNSLSMQAKNGSISLLEEAKQQLIKQLNNSDLSISLLTNSDFYRNLNKRELKNTILSIHYYPIKKTISQQLEKAKYLLEDKKNTKKSFIIISDFIGFNPEKLDSTVNYTFVPLKTNNAKNISIDTVFINRQTSDKIDLNVFSKSTVLSNENVSFSLYDSNRLLGKSAVSFKDKLSQKTQFTIPNTQKINGIIKTTDNQLQFDNSLYFTVDKPDKINVLAIGKDNPFLSKIYTKDQFQFKSTKSNQIDFNNLKKQNTIVLNELDQIENALQKELISFVKQGGSLVIVPSDKIDIPNYNSFFQSLRIGKIKQKSDKELTITKINFNHPILNGVFEKRVTNFQYPMVKTTYNTLLNSATDILKFENQTPFISQIKKQKGAIFWYASPLNNKVSNFKNSPLIVPVFYNIALQSFQVSKLYYLIGKEHLIDVQTKLDKDDVLKIQQKNNAENSFIPLQQIYNEKVRITLKDFPLEAGFYEIKKDSITIKNIAFNYSREESNLQYPKLDYLKNYNNITLSNNISNAFIQLAQENQVKNYWKLLVLLAFVFLVMEMLLIKFWKN